jgi:hypothetical protein
MFAGGGMGGVWLITMEKTYSFYRLLHGLDFHALCEMRQSDKIDYVCRFHVHKQYHVGDDGTVTKNPNPHPVYQPKKYKLLTPASN